MTEPPSRPTETVRESVLWLNWAPRTALVVLALSIVAAQAPARIKLLGLFSAAIGGGMGATAALLTKPHPQRVPRRWLALLFLMTLAGLAGSTWLAFRVDADSRTKSPQQQMAETMMQQMERDSGGELAPSPVVTTGNDFRWYLTRRVRQLGTWNSPWPEVFWLCELVLGGAAALAGWLFVGVSPIASSSKREPLP